MRSLYVLHGDEPLQQQEAADAIRQAARAQGYTERSVFTAAGPHFDWSSVLAACGSRSLFADRQLIELRIPSGKPGKDGSATLVQWVQVLQDQEAVLGLITLPRLDRQTRASAWFSDVRSMPAVSAPVCTPAALNWGRMAMMTMRLVNRPCNGRVM